MQEPTIDKSGLQTTDEVNTTLAFVQLDEKSDRSFCFYRQPGADICLTVNHITQHMLGDCRIFHFGAVPLTDDPSRTFT